MNKYKLNLFAKEIAKELDPVKTINNISTNCYLVGGTLTYGLAQKLYGIKTQKRDIDLIVKSINLEKLPDKWTAQKHHTIGLPKENFGYRINTRKEEIDIILFDNHYPEKGNPGIESYLKNAPFSVQSIAFNLNKSGLIGEIGIKSLIEKKIWINNKDAFSEDRKYWKSKLKQKSDLLGFKIEIK